MARLVLPPEIHLQAPSNLSKDFARLLDAGIDDWGGVSPVTPDHVNPERPWSAVDRLREITEAKGFELAPRLTLYPDYFCEPVRWLDPRVCFPVMDASDAEGLARYTTWSPGADEHPCSGRRPRPHRGSPRRRHAGPGGRSRRDRHALRRPGS